MKNARRRISIGAAIFVAAAAQIGVGVADAHPAKPRAAAAVSLAMPRFTDHDFKSEVLERTKYLDLPTPSFAPSTSDPSCAVEANYGAETTAAPSATPVCFSDRTSALAFIKGGAVAKVTSHAQQPHGTGGSPGTVSGGSLIGSLNYKNSRYDLWYGTHGNCTHGYPQDDYFANQTTTSSGLPSGLFAAGIIGASNCQFGVAYVGNSEGGGHIDGITTAYGCQVIHDEASYTYASFSWHNSQSGPAGSYHGSYC